MITKYFRRSIKLELIFGLDDVFRRKFIVSNESERSKQLLIVDERNSLRLLLNKSSLIVSS